MSSLRRPSFRRTARVLLALTLVTAAAAPLVVPRMGRFLYYQDPLEKADVIFVLGGMPMERVLEGADLYTEGWAPRILLSYQAPDRAELLLRERGIPYPFEAERQRGALVHMGIPEGVIDQLDESALSTAAEAAALAEYTREHHLSSAIVVTSKLHTRRAAMTMRRYLGRSGVKIIMRASRYDQMNPERWWEHRNSLKFVPFEWQRYLLYWVGLAD